MSKKMFMVCKLAAVIVVAFAISAALNSGAWYLPVIALVAAWAFLYFLRGSVKEVVADERDYKIAGKASLLAMQIYAGISAIVGITLYIAKRQDEVLFTVGSVLLYSAAFLMLLYAILFKIYERKGQD